MQNVDRMQRGLYTPELESDACGIGMVCQINGHRSNKLVDDALTMLENMEHRGACGYETNTGDGAGILIKIPDTFFRDYATSINVILPQEGAYAIGFIYLPQNLDLRTKCKNICDAVIHRAGYELLCYRQVPTNNEKLGNAAKSTEPKMEQLFVAKHSHIAQDAFERDIYALRNRITREVVAQLPNLIEEFYFTSFSTKTIVYKGMLNATQVRSYFPDLSDPSFETNLAMVHSRFSTNTLPKWKLAQPFRYIAHNGEINTVKSNINWWKAREKSMLMTEDMESIKSAIPVCSSTLSDSGNFDGVLEFLKQTGYSLPHALNLMIPRAWHGDVNLDPKIKDFYEYNEYIMEPWDGPASICFTDGDYVGAILDRNGLRPSKYMLTKDHTLVLASESGILPYPPEDIVYKKNLSPGNLLLIDMKRQSIVGDEGLYELVYDKVDATTWLNRNREIIPLNYSKKRNEDYTIDLDTRLKAGGFSKEDKDIILNAMMESGKEAIGSMGADIPLAVLSTQAQHISNYFKQHFAQVTNPPIDPLREKEYMSLSTYLGGSLSIMPRGNEEHAIYRLESPFLSKGQYQSIFDRLEILEKTSHFDCIFDATDPKNLRTALIALAKRANKEAKKGAKFLILDNTVISERHTAIPMLLILGAVHQKLIATGMRRQVSLVLKTCDVVEVHHFATLLGYGADAIYPSTSIEYIDRYAGMYGKDYSKLIQNYQYSINEGLLKIMSKIGISTLLSYKGSQSFEILGFSSEVVEMCFKGSISRIEGMTFEQLAKEQLHKHFLAFNSSITVIDEGKYQWKRNGEFHLFNPQSIHLLQHATTTGNYELFKKYTEAINDQSEKACTLRSLFCFKKSKAIDLSQVESKEAIFKRFATGAMSFGSISEEAHTTLAKAMNRIGGKSNSGEGGEDAKRYQQLPNGDSTRSAIKQVASGRFGVTIEYLNNADELQIKMAQGAKPGEGGQLPGHKVDHNIARIRNSTPGVGLISPPPHHDIYSIEDLAQLIFDLKNANERANISVKLVSKAGVGVIAAGVVKAQADHILISGYDGGTGASPLSSIMHAGLPWELGLAETHQTLVKNGLRDRVRLQTDGQIRTGRDMVIATLLGAEEWGIATSALVVSGCILMRKCHLNTCPVGIATQDEALRKKYTGTVDALINYFTFLAEDMREIMASLGFRTVDEMVGRSDLLFADFKTKHWKYQNLNLSPIFYQEQAPIKIKHYKNTAQDHGLTDILDRKLIKFSELAIKDKIQINSIFEITSVNRAVGTMLSSSIAQKYGSSGLVEGSIKFKFRGTAGQSFGAFAITGIEFLLEGEANDYFGKGLSGGTLSVVPDRRATFDAAENVIVGNVALFGATSGKVFIRGRAGERFGVRNSGASAVVEGIGANGCEYMTGGIVVIIGDIGRNFAAGMSGGKAILYDPDDLAKYQINYEMVQLKDCSMEDLDQARTLIRSHFAITASNKSLEILQNWNQYSQYFKLCISPEYERAISPKPVISKDHRTNHLIEQPK